MRSSGFDSKLYQYPFQNIDNYFLFNNLLQEQSRASSVIGQNKKLIKERVYIVLLLLLI